MICKIIGSQTTSNGLVIEFVDAHTKYKRYLLLHIHYQCFENADLNSDTYWSSLMGYGMDKIFLKELVNSDDLLPYAIFFINISLVLMPQRNVLYVVVL